MRTAAYTLMDHKRHEKAIRELQILQITEFIEQCRRILKEHIDKMSPDRIPIKI
jgi:hypothetical protein